VDVVSELPETTGVIASTEAGGSPTDPPTAVAVAQTETDGLPRRRLVFFIVSLALMMASIDQTIVATALPSIQHELHAQINWSGWTITIYALGQVLAMPLAGKLADQFGRKRVFLAAAILFTVSSLCCGLANDIYTLVALRAIQALGGGAFLPSASGIVSEHFGRNRDRAVGMFSSIFPIGGIIGPIIGGFFVTYWSWRGIFLVNVPIGVLVIVLAARFIPHTAPTGSARIDFRGVLLLGMTLLSGMFAITYLGSGNAPVYSPVFLLGVLVSVAGGYLFLRHARLDPNAFIPIKLLVGKGFGVVNVVNFLFGSAALGFGALVPLYAEQRYGIGSLSAGTLLTARAIGMICVAGVAVFTLRRTGYRIPLIVGSLVVAGGLVMMSLTPVGLSNYSWLAVAAAVTGLGMGFSVPASNNASLQLAPTQVAAISGLRGMFRQSGAIVAVSVTTAVLARSSDPGIMLGHVFLVFVGVVLLTIPLMMRIPDHRGRW
jgi:EmrB/QacA subfamily drug resistance transporter